MKEDINIPKNYLLGTLKRIPANNGANGKEAKLRTGEDRERLGPCYVQTIQKPFYKPTS